MDIFNYCQLKLFEFNKNDYCTTTSLFNILIYFLIFLFIGILPFFIILLNFFQ
jgi:hypothetical protein